jgi:hypothetical protein
MFYAGDGVSDLSAARETDLLFAKKGHGMLQNSIVSALADGNSRSDQVLREGGHPIHRIRGLELDSDRGPGDCVSFATQSILSKSWSDPRDRAGKKSVQDAAKEGYELYKAGKA